jgi:hypothetical protein
MGIQFIGTHIDWNVRCAPTRVSAIRSYRSHVALSPHLACSAQYTVACPLHDAFEDVCIVPDRADGAVTYERLLDVVYEFYDDPARSNSLGSYSMFGGIVVITDATHTRVLLNVMKPLSRARVLHVLHGG